jgi:predicted metal-binding membrane protein
LVGNKSALVSVAILCALAWAYVIHLASGMAPAMPDVPAMPDMPNMPGMAATMPMALAWTATDFAAMFLMWAVMMVAMMLPSVTPMILLYGRVSAHRATQNRPHQPTWPFIAGYLLAWVGFSALATLVNWALHTSGLLTSMMGSATSFVGGIVLVVAGIYQWTPLKNACLAHCRSPVGLLSDHWREGRGGAVVMGLHHGAYCVGCCWLLMALLFVLGVMNLAWIAVLTVFILVEKIVPVGVVWSRAAGALMIGWGVWLAALQ